MLRKVLLSKGRSDVISTHKLLRTFTLLVPESEFSEYEGLAEDVQKIPDEVIGLAAIRNWVLDQYPEDIVFLDDDITKFYSNVRKKSEIISNPDVIEQLIINCYVCAKDAGVEIFGFSQVGPDARKYRPTEPFSLTGWTGTIIGVIGKRLRFDERNKLRVDVDACLDSMMEKRIIWIDNRFTFGCIRDTNKGGNAFIRSKANVEREKGYLKRKWGSHIQFKKGKSREGVSVIVERKDRDINV